MKLAVLGRSGQVASELQRQAPKGVELTAIGREDIELSNPAECTALIRRIDADVLINAAAYTAVDRAEEETDLAMLVNGTTPSAIADVAAQRGLPFLHLSTDYVFDGSGSRPWTPTDATTPLNVYGTSKLQGERGITRANGPYVILRTSGIFSLNGHNFVNTIRRVSAERDQLAVVADQIGGPTPACDIAAALHTVAAAFHAGRATSGIYHFAGEPAVSWADFAREIIARTGGHAEVVDIATSAYPTAARRPLNSRLDCATLTKTYDISLPSWQERLSRMLTAGG